MHVQGGGARVRLAAARCRAEQLARRLRRLVLIPGEPRRLRVGVRRQHRRHHRRHHLRQHVLRLHDRLGASTPVGAAPSSGLEARDTAGGGGGDGRGHHPLDGGLRLVVGRRRHEARRDGDEGERGRGHATLGRSQRETGWRTAVAWTTQPAAQQLGVLIALVLAQAAGAAVRLGAARGGAEEAPLQLRPPVLPDGRRALPLGLRRREVVG